MIDADRYWNEKEKELQKRPKCNCCGEPIQEDYCIELPDGRLFCEECEWVNARDLWLEFGSEYFTRRVEEWHSVKEF